VAYMRVMIVSCSYLLYEYLLKLKKYPRPCPRPRDFVLGLVLRSLASINITGIKPHSARTRRLLCFITYVVRDKANDGVVYAISAWIKYTSNHCLEWDKFVLRTHFPTPAVV